MASEVQDMQAPVAEGAASEWVVLVDDQDREIGIQEKLVAHRDGGQLHRAFSVFLFDDRGRMLLQQRAASKYHFPLLWTNACCGHPRPREDVRHAARRRVHEELAVQVDLRPAFTFQYVAEDAATGLTERELDHVLVGTLDAEPTPSPEEIAAIEWCDSEALVRDLAERPARYTPWFRVALRALAEHGLLESR